ncbi:hypothetical protein ABUK85_31700, partial [Nocardiopsis umidischolae]
DLFSDKDRPDLDTSAAPPRTESNAADNRNDVPTGPQAPGPWTGGGEDPGRGGDHAPGPDRDRGGQGSPEQDGRGEGPALAPPVEASSTDRDDLSDIDDVPDLVSDTDSDSDSEFGDTDSVFGGSDLGDPDNRHQPNDDTVRVHQDEDVRTPYPDPFKSPEDAKDPFGTNEAKHPGLGNDPFHPGMNNDGPLTVNFLNAIVPDNPMAAQPPAAEQTTPEPQAQNPGTEHGDRTTPQERSGQEQHTPAPVVAAPINQAAPTPAGQQPPAPGPQNPASDTGQRSAPTDRNSGERSPQRTGGDTRTTDPSAQRSTRDGDVVRTSTESAPPAPESATTGNTTDLDKPNSPTDSQRTNPDNAPAPEQQTSSSDTPQSPPPAAEDSNSDGQHDTEDTGHNPSERDGEQSDERDEGSSGNDDRSQDRDKDQLGDDGNRSGGGEGRGDGDRSGDENNDRSGLEDSEDGKRTDDDTESAHEGDSTTEGDGQERSGEGTSEVTPDSNRPDTQRDPDRPADNGETFGLSPSGSPVPQEGSGSGGRDVQQVGAGRSVRFTPPDDADDASVSSPAVSST